MAKDLSILIPAYGKDDAIGLWATIESCMFDLKNSGLTYDFRVCTNGTNVANNDTCRILDNLRNAGLLGEWVHTTAAQCPSRARSLLVKKCDSTYMFLLDNHCIPCHGYFKQGISTMEKYNVDLLHSVTELFTGYRIDYEYRLTLTQNFWANEGYETPNKQEPYKVAAAGHGGIIHRTITFKEIVGYWDGFDGYSGEEIYYDLKCWLLGKNVYIDPKFIHAHWAPSERKYMRRNTKGYFLNMLMAANIIGGEDWMLKVYNYIKNADVCAPKEEDILDVDRYIAAGSKKPTPQTTKVDGSYLDQARLVSSEHAAWMAANRKLSLEELLVYFSANGIRY